MIKKYDLIIIGGGPSGIWAAYYAAYRKLNVALVEQSEELGGMPKTNYPDKEIYDMPGIMNIKGTSLVNQLKKQMNIQKEMIDVFLNNTYLKISKNHNFQIELINNEILTSKCVLFCLGFGSYHLRTLPDSITNGIKVDYFIKNVNDYKKCDIAISGGGNSALDYALIFSKLNPNNKLYLIHRRNEFRGDESKVNELRKKSNVIIKTPQTIISLNQNQSSQITVTIENKSLEKEMFSVDKVIIQHGSEMKKNIIKIEEQDIEKDKSNPHKYQTSSNFESSINGIYISCILSNQFKRNLISHSINNATIAICDMIDKYFEKRSNIY